MLGRIFENLLAEINPETDKNAKKSTGSFYTPRDIVDFMVDRTISQFLQQRTGISKIKLDALISYSKEDDHLADTAYELLGKGSHLRFLCQRLFPGTGRAYHDGALLPRDSFCHPHRPDV